MNNTSHTGASFNTTFRTPYGTSNAQKNSSTGARFDGVPHAPFLSPAGGSPNGRTPTLSTKREMLSHKAMIEQIKAEQRAARAEASIFASNPTLSARPGEPPSRRWDSGHQAALNGQRETERARQVGQRLAAEKDAREQRRFMTQAAEFVSGMVDGMFSVVSPPGAAAEAVDFEGAAETSGTPLPNMTALQQRAEELGFSVQLHGVDDPASTTLANMTVFFVQTGDLTMTFAEDCKLQELVSGFRQASTKLVGAGDSCIYQRLCQLTRSGFNPVSLAPQRCEDIDPVPVPGRFPQAFSPDFAGTFAKLESCVPPVEGNSTFVIWEPEYMERWRADGGFPYAVVTASTIVPSTSVVLVPSPPDTPAAYLSPDIAIAPSQQEIAPASSPPQMSPAAFQPEPPPAQPSVSPVDAQPETDPANPEPEMAPGDLRPGVAPVRPQSGGLPVATGWGAVIGAVASVGVFLLATQAYRRLRSGSTSANPSQTTVTMSPLGPSANQASASSNLPVQASAATPPLTSVQVDSSSDTSSVVGTASSDSSSDASGASMDDISQVLGAGHSSGE
jgi:hypothetical protein